MGREILYCSRSRVLSLRDWIIWYQKEERISGKWMEKEGWYLSLQCGSTSISVSSESHSEECEDSRSRWGIISNEIILHPIDCRRQRLLIYRQIHSFKEQSGITSGFSSNTVGYRGYPSISETAQCSLLLIDWIPFSIMTGEKSTVAVMAEGSLPYSWYSLQDHGAR